MSKKILSIIGFVAVLIVAVYFYLKSKSKNTTGSTAIAENLSASEDALFSSQAGQKELEAEDTTKMSAEEQLAYEAKQRELTEARKRIEGLRIEYATLVGKAAPVSATEAELANAVDQQKKINALISVYQKESGDSDLSDNDFTTEVKVQQAIDNVRIQKEQAAQAEAQRLQNLRNAWSSRMTEIAALVNQFISNFKDDGTSLRTKAWNTSIVSQLTNLPDRDLVYAERYFNSLGIRYHTSYGKDYVSIPAILVAISTIISYKRSGSGSLNVLRGRLTSLIQRYPFNTNHIDEYGNLTH